MNRMPRERRDALMETRKSASNWVGLVLILGPIGVVGCLTSKEPHAIVPIVRHPPLLVAVAPALNLSGSADLDPVRVAELMAVELEGFPNVDVVPVSRTLAWLADEGKGEVASADEARRLLSRLGADVILVFAVTAYEPYEPPVVGIAAQLYGYAPSPDGAQMGPPVASGRDGAAAEGNAEFAFGALAQSSAVYDASHDDVATWVKEHAAGRGTGDTPYGWRKTLVSQTEYLEFCCRQTARQLLRSVHRAEPVILATGEEGES